MRFKKSNIFFILCFLSVVLGGCKTRESAYIEVLEDGRETEETQEIEAAQLEQETDAAECYVYVCGEVKKPGVYCLAAGSRIYEAVMMAGGLTKEAAADGVNQAETVTDGMMVRIPSREEQEAIQSTENSTGDGKLNLNTATLAELMTLSGIGEAKAQSILAYREKTGGFSSVEEIMQVDGIKEGVYNRIKDSVTVR